MGSSGEDSNFQFSDSGQILVLFLISILIVIAVCGNVALLFAMYTQPKLRTTSNLFIGSLAFANLMTGLYTMPMAFIAIAFKGRWILGDAMCQLGGFIDQLTICAGMVTLGMTSIDRYFLVCHAVKYSDIMTRQRCWACIITIWLWSTCVSIPPFFGWSSYEFSDSSYTCASGLGSSYFKFYVSATFPIPIIIIFPTYYFILKSSMGGTGAVARSKRHRGNLRTAKIILLIIIIFAVCVFPVFLIGIILSAGVVIPKSQGLAFGVIWLLIANSSINPILYGLLNKNFRTVYMVKARRCLGLPHLTPHKSPGLSSSMGPVSTVVNGNEGSSNQCTSRCNFNAVLEDH
ncbi:hypothetical protein ACHWQZ_G011864 [Mnemiopsis leidyi]